MELSIKITDDKMMDRSVEVFEKRGGEYVLKKDNHTKEGNKEGNKENNNKEEKGDSNKEEKDNKKEEEEEQG